jgi:excisionase family DNA binding protein
MKLLTTKEVAEKLGVSVRRVQAMISDSVLPATKLGRDYLVKESDLDLVKDRKSGRPAKEKLK